MYVRSNLERNKCNCFLYAILFVFLIIFCFLFFICLFFPGTWKIWGTSDLGGVSAVKAQLNLFITADMQVGYSLLKHLMTMELTAESHFIPLSDGNRMPLIGLGTYADPRKVWQREKTLLWCLKRCLMFHRSRDRHPKELRTSQSNRLLRQVTDTLMVL